MRLADIDLDEVLAEAMLAEGVSHQQVSRATGLDAQTIAALDTTPEGTKSRRAPVWTEEEEAFIRDHVGTLGEVGVAAALGRSPTGVKIRRQRRGIPAASKQPNTRTLNQVARILHKDIHSVIKWVEMGVLRAEDVPTEGRAIRRVTLAELKRFVTRPRHWVYFDPLAVTDPSLARLVRLAYARWGDVWLTPGQVAAIHGVDGRAVNKAIHNGRLPAVRWGNWWIRRSDARQVRFFVGRGANPRRDRTRLDGFLVLGAAVGVFHSTLGTMTGINGGTVDNRMNTLRQRGLVEDVIARGELDVRYRPGDGALFADWKHHRRRFPGLARAMDCFAAGVCDVPPCPDLAEGPGAGARLNTKAFSYVRGVYAAWSRWYEAPSKLTRGLVHAGSKGREVLLRRVAGELAALGIDPYAGELRSDHAPGE